MKSNDNVKIRYESRKKICIVSYDIVLICIVSHDVVSIKIILINDDIFVNNVDYLLKII